LGVGGRKSKSEIERERKKKRKARGQHQRINIRCSIKGILLKVCARRSI